MKLQFKHVFIFLSVVGFNSFAQEIAVVKYNGGGDWYSNPTSLPNLIAFCNQNIQTKIKSKPETVELTNSNLFTYPYIHITGHGNIILNEVEKKNLRDYLLSGGFLHIDDNFGLDQYIRREMKNVFPDKEFIELPVSHEIFQKPFTFKNGLPKIHQHNGKKAQAFGLMEKNRLICIYTYESDLGNGWEDKEVHNDPTEVREQALKMGANIIFYAFNH